MVGAAHAVAHGPQCNFATRAGSMSSRHLCWEHQARGSGQHLLMLTTSYVLHMLALCHGDAEYTIDVG